MKFSIDEKYFNIEGVTLSSPCPNCGKVDELDLYEGAPEPMSYEFRCRPCKRKWSVKAVLRISVEVVE